MFFSGLCVPTSVLSSLFIKDYEPQVIAQNSVGK